MASHGHEQGDRRRRLAREWTTCWPRYGLSKDFKTSPVAPYAELAAAADGPVIVLNVSSFGCHALVVRSGNPVQVVHLPDLHPRYCG